MRTQAFELEKFGDLSPCRQADDDAPRLGQRLQASRQIRHFPNYCLFLCRSFTNKIADNHQAASKSNSYSQCLTCRSQPGNLSSNRKASAHRPLGLVLLSLRPAKICQDTIAHVFGDITVELADCVGNTALV